MPELERSLPPDHDDGGIRTVSISWIIPFVQGILNGPIVAPLTSNALSSSLGAKLSSISLIELASVAVAAALAFTVPVTSHFQYSVECGVVD